MWALRSCARNQLCSDAIHRGRTLLRWGLTTGESSFWNWIRQRRSYSMLISTVQILAMMMQCQTTCEWKTWRGIPKKTTFWWALLTKGWLWSHFKASLSKPALWSVLRNSPMPLTISCGWRIGQETLSRQTKKSAHFITGMLLATNPVKQTRSVPRAPITWSSSTARAVLGLVFYTPSKMEQYLSTISKGRHLSSKLKQGTLRPFSVCSTVLPTRIWLLRAHTTERYACGTLRAWSLSKSMIQTSTLHKLNLKRRSSTLSAGTPQTQRSLSPPSMATWWSTKHSRTSNWVTWLLCQARLAFAATGIRLSQGWSSWLLRPIRLSLSRPKTTQRARTSKL